MEFTRKQPDRGGQICGTLLQVGGPHNGGDTRWCVRRKAKGLYVCQGCETRLASDEARGAVRMVPRGSAIGVGMREPRRDSGAQGALEGGFTHLGQAMPVEVANRSTIVGE